MLTTKSRVYKSVASAALAATAFTGLGIASAGSATAAPVAVSSVAASSVAGPTVAGTSLTPAAAGVTSALAPAAQAGTNGLGSIVLKVLVKAVIAAAKTISGLFTKLVNAVVAGYNAFVKFWNTQVPTWIKNLITGWSIYDIWSALRDLLGL